MERRYHFDFLFLRRFLYLHKIFYKEKYYLNLIIFIFYLGISGLYTFLGYQVILIPGNFYKVLCDKDNDLFKSTCFKSTAFILGISLVKSLKIFIARRLLVKWRRALCSDIQAKYLQNRHFYKLVVFDEEIDNPDQRITADVNSLVTTYGDLLGNDLFILPITTGFYAYKAYEGAGWLGPTAMLGMFLLSFLNKVLMTPVASKTANLERNEGDFRQKHMNIMDHAEAFAFQGSEETELQKTKKYLDSVCSAQEQLFNWTFPLDFSTNLFGYLGSIATYLVISVPIFSGYYDHLSNGDLAKVISNNSSFCMQLVWQLTQFVNMSSKVANMAGSTHRVVEMLEVLSDYCDTPSIVTEDDNDSKELLLMEGVDIVTPKSNTPIIKSLTLTVAPHSNLLIMGPSGSGKTSILRTVCSLWPRLGGSLRLIRREDIFFFPQQPFFSEGSLREQITRPENERKDTDEILRLLDVTNLSNLVERCEGLDNDPGWNWAQVLSPGETQRLVWTRLLYQNPRLALLDEATSSISEDTQEVLYRACEDKNITLVSIGHRRSIRQFHHNMIILDNKGGWKLSKN